VYLVFVALVLGHRPTKSVSRRGGLSANDHVREVEVPGGYAAGTRIGSFAGPFVTCSWPRACLLRTSHVQALRRGRIPPSTSSSASGFVQVQVAPNVLAI